MKTQYIKPLIVAGVFLFNINTWAQAESPTALDTSTINEIDALLKQNTAADEAPEASDEVINKPMTKKELKKLNISDTQILFLKLLTTTTVSSKEITCPNLLVGKLRAA